MRKKYLKAYARKLLYREDIYILVRASIFRIIAFGRAVFVLFSDFRSIAYVLVANVLDRITPVFLSEVSRLKEEDSHGVIALRDDYLGPCVVDLLVRANAKNLDIVLLVRDVPYSLSLNRDYLTEINVSVKAVLKSGTYAAAAELIRAKFIVAFESVPEINAASLMKNRRNNIKIVKVPDGILTKATANLIPNYADVKRPPFKMRVRSCRTNVDYVAQSGVDALRVYSHTGVASPCLIRRVGLPRISRAFQLSQSSLLPITPQSLSVLLASAVGTKKVLLALTKSKRCSSDIDNLLCQLDMRSSQLDDLLLESNITLFVKEHQRTVDWREDIKKSRKYGHNVVYLNQKLALSSVDLAAHMDGLLTDISSIYVDVLPFDIPIGFIGYDKWKCKNRLLYPDYPFYPGIKINNSAELGEYCLDLLNGRDEYRAARREASAVLLGEGVDNAYWDSLFT